MENDTVVFTVKGIAFLLVVFVLQDPAVALLESVTATFEAIGAENPIRGIMLFIAVVVGILIVPLPQR